MSVEGTEDVLPGLVALGTVLSEVLLLVSLLPYY